MLESSRFGSLPKVGADGLRPLEAYRSRAADGLATGPGVKRVAIVVGGLGISTSATLEAIAKLPAAVTLAFAPYGPDLASHAAKARDAGHELLLQVPMEPFDYPDSDPGPHTLLASARAVDNIDHLHWAMGRFTGYVGLVNYMGGKFTAEDKAITPVLREVTGRGLGFLDDGSSSRSRVVSLSAGGPAARAEIVLDATAKADAIDKALERLEAAANGTSVVVATASALPVTVERIARWSRGLEARGFVLVPASAALLQGAKK